MGRASDVISQYQKAHVMSATPIGSDTN